MGMFVLCLKVPLLIITTVLDKRHTEFELPMGSLSSLFSKLYSMSLFRGHHGKLLFSG